MSKRGKMPISERAKQFAPFAAVGGLDEALAKKEKEKARMSRIELLDDAAEHLNARLAELYVDDYISVTYYFQGEYLTAEGVVKNIDKFKKVIIIGDREIHFKDLYSIK